MVAGGSARPTRERSLQMLCDQLPQTQEHLAGLEAEAAALLQRDGGATSLQGMLEFVPNTVAVLRAELVKAAGFRHSHKLVAYVGLDIRVWECGKWRGQRRAAKRGSGRVRRALYLAAIHSLTRLDSAFAAYYRHLVGQGITKMSALMTLTRKLWTVAYRVLKSGSRYDATKVWVAHPAAADGDV
jgi:transposase